MPTAIRSISRTSGPTPTDPRGGSRQCRFLDVRREVRLRVRGDERWTALDAPTGEVYYEWDDSSTYIREPPFFKDFPLEEPGVTDIDDARTLMLLGDTVTTDHISPAGPFQP